MPRVGRIHVEVEIIDEDGTTTIHEAIGVPKPGTSPTIGIAPHHRTRISRSGTRPDQINELIDVGVNIQAVLVETPGSRLFGVDKGIAPDREVEATPSVITIEENRPGQ
ncbi:hypothetical protein QDA02_gp10 [Microbacterium phage Margaery]|uniref:Uncharacterized protein n=1 Tax=Microbacterium phage Margaery TaxID=2591217 RepID=A0A514DHH1_9CAUD|nr:hypothetical protein QDA02_gp10 [Microbacterium phage Margaery]QDH93068.1 hypothetical protein PBI_MARGAERY_10 [Microbacterium phage Margaery]